uniref:Uncharacterized protein n=1 Tax=Desulfobacca acetoxidans TaxID=60893 RepID=A0A7V6A3X6_9BACT
MFRLFLILRRVLVLVAAVVPGVVMVMHLDSEGKPVGGGMIVKVPVDMGMGMLMGVDPLFMLMLMVMGVDMFVGMQVLVYMCVFHDRGSLEVFLPVKIRKIFR